VSDYGAQDERRMRGRQNRVVLAPVAGVKLAEAKSARPGSTKPQSANDGDKNEFVAGESTK
jgi:hypothetical protein